MKNRTFTLWILGILTLFTVLMCWGCSRRGSPAEVPAEALSRPFEAKAAIRLGDLALTADLNRTAPGQATVRLTEPASLSGMTFSYDGSQVAVTFLGITLRMDEDSRLVSSAASILVNSIDAAARDSGMNVKLEGNALVVEGESESGRFFLTLDKETGAIASLTLPELDFSCRFDDVLFSP